MKRNKNRTGQPCGEIEAREGCYLKGKVSYQRRGEGVRDRRGEPKRVA